MKKLKIYLLIFMSTVVFIIYFSSSVYSISIKKNVPFIVSSIYFASDIYSLTPIFSLVIMWFKTKQIEYTIQKTLTNNDPFITFKLLYIAHQLENYEETKYLYKNKNRDLKELFKLNKYLISNNPKLYNSIIKYDQITFEEIISNDFLNFILYKNPFSLHFPIEFGNLTQIESVNSYNSLRNHIFYITDYIKDLDEVTRALEYLISHLLVKIMWNGVKVYSFNFVFSILKHYIFVYQVDPASSSLLTSIQLNTPAKVLSFYKKNIALLTNSKSIVPVELVSDTSLIQYLPYQHTYQNCKETEVFKKASDLLMSTYNHQIKKVKKNKIPISKSHIQKSSKPYVQKPTENTISNPQKFYTAKKLFGTNKNIKFRYVINKVIQKDCIPIEQTGSHIQLRTKTGGRVTVPRYQEYSTSLLEKIANQIPY